MIKGHAGDNLFAYLEILYVECRSKKACRQRWVATERSESNRYFVHKSSGIKYVRVGITQVPQCLKSFAECFTVFDKLCCHGNFLSSSSSNIFVPQEKMKKK